MRYVLCLLALALLCAHSSSAMPEAPTSGSFPSVPADQNNTRSPPAFTNKISLEGNEFKPRSILVFTGTTVQWTNNDAVVHSVTSDASQPETFDADPVVPKPTPPQANVGPVKDFEHDFTKAGVTKYHCKYHPNMTAEVHVVTTVLGPRVPIYVGESADAMRFYFAPSDVTINISQEASFIHTGRIAHSIKFENASLGTKPIAPGATVNYIFDEPGTYTYECGNHPQRHSGKIIVVGTPAKNATGPAKPPPKKDTPGVGVAAVLVAGLCAAALFRRR